MDGSLLNLFAVFVGSALGGTARHWLSDAIGRVLGPHFPWGTLVVNGTGSTLAGTLAALLAGSGLAHAPETRLLFIVGFCGSYTTVSSFALQSLDLAREARWLPCCLNVLGSLLLCLAGAWLGLQLGSLFADAGVAR